MEDHGGRVKLDGVKIKSLRKKRCLSQNSLVELCNEAGGVISLSTLKRAENGHKVYYRTAREIAETLEITITEIVEQNNSDEVQVSTLSSHSPEMDFLVGRRSQLYQTRFILHGVKILGNGHVYYIRGVAGIGKSHFVQEVQGTAENEGFLPFIVQIVEGSSTKTELLTHLQKNLVQCLKAPQEDVTSFFEQVFKAPEIPQEIKPYLCQIFDLDLPIESLSTDQYLKDSLEVTSLLYLLSLFDKPVMLSFEDIHWAEGSLLISLKKIVAGIRTLPVALVLTSRTENDPLDRIWRCSVLNTGFTTLDLSPLSMMEAESISQNYSSVSAEYRNECLSLANGNPLFLKQLLANYPNSLESLPNSMETLISDKLKRLSLLEVQCLERASALGVEFHVDTVTSLLGDVSLDLDALIQRYLILPLEMGYYSFAHDLIRKGVYQQIPSDDKYKIHQDIAEYYENIDATLYAIHLKLAQSEKAKEALQSVAEEHYRKQNFSEALVKVDMALSIKTEEEKFDLLFLKAVLLKLLDLPSKCTHYFERALELCDSWELELKVCLELIEVYAVNKRFERSEFYLANAQRLARKLKSCDDQDFVAECKQKLNKARHSLTSANTNYTKPLDFLEQLNQLPVSSTQSSDSATQIQVAILHSTTGFLRALEEGVVKTTIMAIEEINENGGLLGEQISYQIFDGASDEMEFQRQAREITEKHQIKTIFGTSTSSSRMQVKEVVEKNEALLIYPFQYEGLEVSPNIAYIGPPPSLQTIPSIEWLIEKEMKSFYFVGSDYVYPVVTNEILRDSIDSFFADVVGEAYVPLGGEDFSDIIKDIAEKKPDSIVMTLVGLESNKEFFRQFHEAGLSTDDITVLSLVLSEYDLCEIPTDHSIGVYSVFSYFQNQDDVVNDDFLRRYRARYGDERVGGYMESAYTGVHLWAKAVQKSQSVKPEALLAAMGGLSHYGPGGIAYMDEVNQHVWRHVRIAQVGIDSEYHIVWNSEQAIAPEPYPKSRSVEEWHDFVDSLKERWSGQWESLAELEE